MPPMRTIIWSSSGNRFASRCLSPFLAYIISSTKFTQHFRLMPHAIHITTLKRMLQSPEPVDLKLWTRSGEIQCWHRCISLRYDFYKGMRRMNLLESNEIRQLRDVCVFEINGLEVFMWNYLGWDLLLWKELRTFAVTDSATLPIRTANQGGTSFLYTFMNYTKQPLDYPQIILN